MRSFNRKTTPEVRRGRVQKKNNWTETPGYYTTPQPLPLVDRLRPGPGYRHLLKQRDVHRFIAILPDWNELSAGLSAIVLAPGEWNTSGYHVPGVVHVCAWETELWHECTVAHYQEHRDIFERLGIPCELHSDYVLCKWTEPTARAYQLLHILLHELGHHHDRITTKSKLEASRGEPYAEAYARRYETVIWDHYLREFNLY